MKKVFIEQSLLNELEISRQNPRSRNDSGVNESSDLVKEKNNLLHYLKIARALMQNFMNIPENTPIDCFALPEETISIASFTKKYLKIEEKKNKFSSTKITGITTTGGLSNHRLWSAKKQIADLSKHPK